MAVTSILTSCGIAVYDGHFQQVVTQVAVRPGAASAIDNTMVDTGGHAQHVHSDYNPLSSTLSNSFQYQSPVIGPRRRSQHKQLMRTLEQGGRHAFDDAFMPILS